MRTNGNGYAGLTFELTLTKVQSVVRENTELSIQKISCLGAGFDFETYLVNDEWVFRFPITMSAADALVKERRVLKGLSLPTVIPNIEHWLDRPFGYPLPVAGYKFIRGESLESKNFDSHERSQLAIELGNVLQSLHESGGEQRTVEASSTGDLSSEIAGYLDLDLIGLTLSEKLSVTQFVQRYSHLEAKFPCVRIHGDLGAEHVITNSKNQLKGLIDWSNTTYGNRFKDFVGLWGWGGDSFVVQVLSNYDVFPQQSDWKYIRTHGLTYCFHRLNYAIANKYTKTSVMRNRLRRRIKETVGMNPSDLP